MYLDHEAYFFADIPTLILEKDSVKKNGWLLGLVFDFILISGFLFFVGGNGDTVKKYFFLPNTISYKV